MKESDKEKIVEMQKLLNQMSNSKSFESADISMKISELANQIHQDSLLPLKPKATDDAN